MHALATGGGGGGGVVWCGRRRSPRAFCRFMASRKNETLYLEGLILCNLLLEILINPKTAIYCHLNVQASLRSTYMRLFVGLNM